MSGITLALVARVPASGVAAFQSYEAQVLPLLAEHGGELQRRMRNADGTVELHIVRFASAASLDGYRSDARREAAGPLLQQSGAVLELMELKDV